MVTPEDYRYLFVTTKTLSCQVSNTNSTEMITSLQEKVFMSWTDNSRFIDGLLDIFQVYGKT